MRDGDCEVCVVCRMEEGEGEIQKMGGVFILVLPKEGQGNKK